MYSILPKGIIVYHRRVRCVPAALFRVVLYSLDLGVSVFLSEQSTTRV